MSLSVKFNPSALLAEANFNMANYVSAMCRSIKPFVVVPPCLTKSHNFHAGEKFGGRVAQQSAFLVRQNVLWWTP